ncbi:8576_t:CDS:2 [Acaulospora morrowiae]|uniref:8576_t:CDS:1 n=1 Tax=Acaulospora morrowiae TaxID=94023 RepID=A0A9N9GD74_9GLOM|nr:8576_t:CDS:2 [Acaulospora morrowiae]
MTEISLARYDTAPTKIIPSQQLFSVEYPGYVKNIDKVLQTLGGQRGLKKAVNEDLMELRFRPGDPFCHPINGDVIPTSNLLLKVTWKRKKRKTHVSQKILDDHTDNGDVKDVDFKVIGIISKTCRFRGMADYQFVPNPNDTIPKYRKALENFDVDTIMDFDSISSDGNFEDNLPPPSFSRIECPMEYGYRQNMAVVKVLVQKGDGQPPALKLINRKFSPIPDMPPPDAVKHKHLASPESVSRIQKVTVSFIFPLVEGLTDGSCGLSVIFRKTNMDEVGAAKLLASMR